MSSLLVVQCEEDLTVYQRCREGEKVQLGRQPIAACIEVPGLHGLQILLFAGVGSLVSREFGVSVTARMP